MGFISVRLISIHRVDYSDPISPPPMTFLRDPSLRDPFWRLRYLSGIAVERWRRLVTTPGANTARGAATAFTKCSCWQQRDPLR
jgi:hypothetical protein